MHYPLHDHANQRGGFFHPRTSLCASIRSILLQPAPGDKLQKPSGSICGGPVLLPLLTSNRKVSRVFSFEILYRQIVDGKRAHSTAKIATSWRTNREGPPWMGIAKIEEGVSGPADLGVETYKISEPSGVTLGCESWSAAVTRLSANGRSVACLKISKV